MRTLRQRWEEVKQQHVYYIKCPSVCIFVYKHSELKKFWAADEQELIRTSSHNLISQS